MQLDFHETIIYSTSAQKLAWIFPITRVKKEGLYGLKDVEKGEESSLGVQTDRTEVAASCSNSVSMCVLYSCLLFGLLCEIRKANSHRSRVLGSKGGHIPASIWATDSYQDTISLTLQNCDVHCETWQLKGFLLQQSADSPDSTLPVIQGLRWMNAGLTGPTAVLLHQSALFFYILG